MGYQCICLRKSRYCHNHQRHIKTCKAIQEADYKNFSPTGYVQIISYEYCDWNNAKPRVKDEPAGSKALIPSKALTKQVQQQGHSLTGIRSETHQQDFLGEPRQQELALKSRKRPYDEQSSLSTPTPQ
ncbi:hypothetical protein BGZ83_000379 [Gryganskiella cystojenkinii]|nr:hypothetical protein BGZ83_000379 [Gryganskiella cystojenkinii]